MSACFKSADGDIFGSHGDVSTFALLSHGPKSADLVGLDSAHFFGLGSGYIQLGHVVR